MTRSSFLLLALFALALAAATLRARDAGAATADRLVILSTTDVKGKTSPCGCKIPKGGLARQASFADSIRSEYEHVLLVDNGGFFPEDDAHRPHATFLMDAMKMLGVSAVGFGERDLRFGYSFYKRNAESRALPVVCANLYDKATKKTTFRPWLIEKIGGVNVGFFALMSDKAELGPGRDSLYLTEPPAAARAAVAELKKKGATVIVLLSQLGKVESEDVVVAVDGVDVVIAGHNVPMFQTGRMIKNTMAVYGGEQGQNMGRTILTLDARGQVTGRENEVFSLTAEVGEKESVARLVKQFEDQVKTAEAAKPQ
jgi:2',3'-cyclic-nucleotide 2'-phosphodiesterase (5'-nucleotidase family)